MKSTAPRRRLGEYIAITTQNTAMLKQNNLNNTGK
jgi:hypothetical protein